jgi:hypothetical protein
LLFLLVAAAAGAGPVQVRASESPRWYGGLEFEIGREGADGPRLVLWPHEGIAIGDRFEWIRLDAVSERVEHATGAASWRVRAPQAPEVSLRVSLEPRGDAVHVAYRLRNDSARPLHAAIAPCLQLPADFFGTRAGWERTKRVFVVAAESGLRWVSDARQARGRAAGPDDPDPDRSPWAQHFPASALHGPPASGLALFGVADERVAADVIGASTQAGDLHVVAAAEGHLGVTYALLNCLHAGLGASLAPGEERELSYRIYVFAGDFDALLARVARDFARGTPFAREPAFVPPDWSERVLVAGPIAGAAAYELPLSLPEPCAQRAALSLDVALDGAGAAPDPPFSVSLALEAPGTAPRSVVHLLSTGKPRRLVVPLTAPRAGPARLAVALAERGAGTRLRVEEVTLHAPRIAGCLPD